MGHRVKGKWGQDKATGFREKVAFKERAVSEPERTQLPPSCPAMTFLVWTVFVFGFSCSFSLRLPGRPLPSSVPCVSLPLPEACTSILRISFCSLQLCTPHPWEAASPPSEGRSVLPGAQEKYLGVITAPLFLSQLTPVNSETWSDQTRHHWCSHLGPRLRCLTPGLL